MHYEFIDATKSDKDTRSRARSHAMKGKNVGKKHPNRRQASKLQLRTGVVACQTWSESDTYGGRIVEDKVLTGRPWADALLPLQLAVSTAPQRQHVIRQCE